MRILVVDEEIPYPLNSGKRLRTFNLLKPLATRHEIHFICRKHEGLEDTSPKALTDIGIHPIVVDDPIRQKFGAGFYAALLTNILSQFPYTVTSHRSGILGKKIKETLDSQPFDLVHCEWTPYAINLLPFFNRIPTVVDAHNVEAMIWYRNYTVEKNILKKAYIFLQWKKMERFERDHFPLFSKCISVSEQDAEIIANVTKREKVDVVSNGVDIDYFSQDACKSKLIAEEHDLVFTGSLDWRPNVDGILYFLDMVFPIFQEKYSDSKFYIVGRNPMAVLRDKVAGLKNVVLTGTVDDVRPYMNDNAIYVVPLRVGGGSRLKILEAFSMRMPVVSTSIGAEGLEVINGEDIQLADTPEDFFQAVDTIITTSTLAKKMGKRGRTLVEDHYQWDVLASRLERNWNEIVSGGLKE